MSLRWSLVLVVLALVVCFAATTTDAAPSKKEVEVEGPKEVEKRYGYGWVLYIEKQWIVCWPVIIVRIRCYIVWVHVYKREDNLVDIEIPYSIYNWSDPEQVFVRANATIPAGQTEVTSDPIDLPGNTTTQFGVRYLDPFKSIYIIIFCGICGNGYGDPHIKTFDGYHYNYNGRCSYTLTKECGKDNPNFEITADFRGSGEDITRMSAFNVTSHGKQIIRINDDDSVLIKGAPMTTTSANIGNNEGHVITSDGHVMMELYQPSLSLSWGRRTHRLTIGLGEENMPGNVCGLLGNADGNPRNDFVKPNGERTFDNDDFGDSWEIPGSCPQKKATVEDDE